MSYKQEYIDSVDGCAHQSAVEIIEALEEENDNLLQALRFYADAKNTKNGLFEKTIKVILQGMLSKEPKQ